MCDILIRKPKIFDTIFLFFNGQRRRKKFLEKMSLFKIKRFKVKIIYIYLFAIYLIFIYYYLIILFSFRSQFIR